MINRSILKKRANHILGNRVIMLVVAVSLFATFSVFGFSIFTHKSADSNLASSYASAAFPEDINSDGKVDIFDLSVLLSKWGTSDTSGDLNKDGTVNIFDLSLILSKWGQTAAVPQESNIALTPVPTVTASSQNSGDGQTALKAVDGSVDGYPNDYSKEWVTVNEGAGSWIQLTWGQTVTIGRVVLHDRPNAGDQVTGGTLVFSDGSTVGVGPLNNDGSATTITFASRSVTSVRFNILTVSGTTANVGLAEMEVWGYVGSSGNLIPIANAGPDQTVATGANVTLNGIGSSDPESGNLTYLWSQLSGPSVSLSSTTIASPTFTAGAAGTYVFSLVVSDGTSSSAADTVTITASAGGSGHSFKILPLGDSITESNYSTGPDANGYRLALLNNLPGYTIDYVGPNNKGDSQLQDKDLAGWSGACIKDGPCWSAGSVMLYPRTTDIINTYQPDLVIMQGGANDFCCNSISDAAVAQRMRDWLDLIYSLSPQVHIILIGANTTYHPGYESLVQSYVTTLKSSGKLIEYLPMMCYNDSSTLAERQNPVAVSCPDTVHPDAVGYQKLGDRLAPLVTSFFP